MMSCTAKGYAAHDYLILRIACFTSLLAASRHRAPKGAVELAQEVDHQFGDLLETLRNEFRQGQRQQAEEPSTDGVKVDEEVVHVEAAEKSNALWLDKYAPRHFMDLLSDDVRILSSPYALNFGSRNEATLAYLKRIG